MFILPRPSHRQSHHHQHHEEKNKRKGLGGLAYCVTVDNDQRQYAHTTSGGVDGHTLQTLRSLSTSSGYTISREQSLVALEVNQM